MTTLRQFFSLHLLCVALVLPAHAQMDAAAERARIAQEKSAADQRLLEQEKACESRFAVTSCVEAARKQHRDAVAPLRQEEFLLDDAQRQQRAAQRRAQLEEKAARTRGDAVPPEAPSSETDHPAASPRKPPSFSHKAISPEQQDQLRKQRVQKQREARAQADERVKAQQQKIETAQRRKAEVEKRNAEKAASGKPPPAALKVPQPAPP